MKPSTHLPSPTASRGSTRRFWSAIVVGLCCSLLATGRADAAEPSPKPLKILLVTGGCCHDYTAQKELIKRGLEARAYVEVTAIEQGDGTREAKIPLYEDADWAKGYDLVIHDECFGRRDRRRWSERVLAPHKKGFPPWSSTAESTASATAPITGTSSAASPRAGMAPNIRTKSSTPMPTIRS